MQYPGADPILVTPVLYKERHFKQPLYRSVLEPLWAQARRALSTCRRLVLIGYSMPPTDFDTRRMLLEVFARRDLEELIVVSPDTSIVQRLKELCHFNKPVISCKDLREYLRLVGAGTPPLRWNEAPAGEPNLEVQIRRAHELEPEQVRCVNFVSSSGTFASQFPADSIPLEGQLIAIPLNHGTGRSAWFRVTRVEEIKQRGEQVPITFVHVEPDLPSSRDQRPVSPMSDQIGGESGS